jgi:CheY-like chemotaxis protein
MTASKSTHVLLVEDTLTQALMMKHLLESQRIVESQKFEVTVAKDGTMALTFLSSERPDLILSDISMPEPDGYELCRLVKGDPATNDIPFVLMSSFHDVSEIASVLNCGADSFMLKRFDQQYVIDGLNDVLADCLTSRLSRDQGASDAGALGASEAGAAGVSEPSGGPSDSSGDSGDSGVPTAKVPKGSIDQLIVTQQGLEYTVTGDATRLATMVFAAFRTIVHLLPLLKED